MNNREPQSNVVNLMEVMRERLAAAKLDTADLFMLDDERRLLDAYRSLPWHGRDGREMFLRKIEAASTRHLVDGYVVVEVESHDL